MRRAVILIVALLTALVLVLPTFAHETQDSDQPEQIEAFDVVIHIQPNASLLVEETIVYNFGVLSRHGIYRDIPLDKLRISDVAVSRNDKPEPFQLLGSGKNKQIKIGNTNELISGKQTFAISYTIKGAINYFEEHDELYWNVTGTDWQVPIESVFAQVFLPQFVAEKDLKLDCFRGSFGSNTSCVQTEVLSDGSVQFADSHLQPGEGLTFAFGFPKNVVAQPTAMQIFFRRLQTFWPLLIPLLVLIWLLHRWWKFGRDPKGQSPIVAEYDPPSDLTPAEVGTIIDGRVNKKDLSSEIIHLAVLEFLKIEKVPKKSFWASVTTN
ncbi:MAG: hypothetical protein A3H72_00660 [Candidatus Doudnabacteria bacterium RIFCSPLOWO2_02_FULL_48_8]|uniref:DUF2207 domain-containing protein n=1 Tax=Candidatus Doudnabacteria bacterium RIFCSPHIGHO2_01_FULL_46_24 TaxID=1817825 RepID=A0A1F5NTP9_9BACT|nr:MAG: hypothetical protein A2720_03690 [Candidatus Doudnabacteria bacterium RIFCSPHIGHO2_01_FULL_46_24]OGE95243.1 MAG: hypothetical protein A3H72_00660 [Candidatus Doudnabacteria bacterium RIFCSPLOWO2_02_FULL_48_8]OGE96013.1 MAG: hypothetical protein A3E98_03025 [Candidatus Doudnabacteria bacterium RIFCSPHIGHO2_12_FULL_48_11]